MHTKIMKLVFLGDPWANSGCNFQQNNSSHFFQNKIITYLCYTYFVPSSKFDEPTKEECV